MHAKRATYADVTVVCGPLELDPLARTRQTVLNPSVLFEVLSPTTHRDDQGPQLESYRLIPSVQAVVLIAQDKPEISAHCRQPDGSWAAQTLVDGQLDLPAIHCQLVLAEVHEALPEA